MLGFVTIKVDAVTVVHDTLGNSLMEQLVVLLFTELVELLQLHTTSDPRQTCCKSDPGGRSSLKQRAITTASS